jgi:hypothetical protein
LGNEPNAALLTGKTEQEGGMIDKKKDQGTLRQAWNDSTPLTRKTPLTHHLYLHLCSLAHQIA